VKKLLIYYSFILSSILAGLGLLGASNYPQLISGILFYPLAVYFFLQIVPDKKAKALKVPQILTVPKDDFTKLEKLEPEKQRKFDFDRRTFIKLIGSAGISVFLFSIFTKRAEAAFFGSVPGPGTVALKDTGGTQIDPAEKKPTDGYNITELDDSLPSYYGYVNKDGAWFIIKEDPDHPPELPYYSYVRGSSSFSTSWTGRVGLSYDYFDNIF
jgi:hypothetical protein